MARPIYNHELLDPDFSWLLSTFKENHPEYVTLECVGLPVVMIHLTAEEFQKTMLPEIIDSELSEPTPVEDQEEYKK